ncbi:MAG: fibronectin type III domain-containing protein, partial [Acidobacteria bacterium]|nr:fibronectin type III domain-containing protein [Acidobacteriota bacterium]
TNSAPPSAARNLEISQITATGMLLNWQPPVSTNGKPVSNYLVELSSDAGVTWVSYQKPDSTLTSVTISGLVPAKSYSFRVFAVNQIGASQASPLISATTLATVPSAPRTLTASAITKTSFTLNWQAPLTDNGSAVSDYQIEMSTNAGASWIKIDKPVSNSTSQNIPNLPAGSSNLFRVIAVNALGLGQPSEVLLVTTKPLVIPAAPASISFTNLKINAASITWSPVTSDLKISNYIIEISADGANWSVVPKKVSTSTSMTITSLSPATNYSIRVAAINADGQGGYVQGSFTTLGTISSAPSKPNLVSVTMNSATISWDAPAIDGGSPITNYIVEMSGGGSSWTLIQKEISPARSISVADLKPATKYSFRVRAVNSKGMSKVSPILSIATSPTVPGIPTGLAVKSQTASATVLSWTAPNNGGSRLTDYMIEFSLDEGQSWQVLTKGLWTIPIYKLVNLKPKTSYLFRVSAKNSVGLGAVSQNIAVVTP